MIGETTFQPYAINTFSGNGKKFTTLTPAHYVTPYEIKPYRKGDGTYVSGSWRDGDPTINRSTGYLARNPGSTPIIIPRVLKY